MFLPFTISSEEIKKLTRGHLLNREFLDMYHSAQEVIKSCADINRIKDSLINGTKLQEQWFPVDVEWMNFDVFISHSHKDMTPVILPLASWMYEKLGLKCFVDSLFWLYADDLLKKMDEWYAKQPDGYYNYQTRNYTTSHVHAMLSMALMKMMAKTECVIFVDSDNSIKYQKGDAQTPSPWIYEEINFAQNLQIAIPDRYVSHLIPICESGGALQTRSFSASMDIRYDVDLSSFISIKSKDLLTDYIMANRNKKALDYLYSMALELYKTNK